MALARVSPLCTLQVMGARPNQDGWHGGFVHCRRDVLLIAVA
jgi:hypothetical protein